MEIDRKDIINPILKKIREGKESISNEEAIKFFYFHTVVFFTNIEFPIKVDKILKEYSLPIEFDFYLKNIHPLNTFFNLKMNELGDDEFENKRYFDTLIKDFLDVSYLNQIDFWLNKKQAIKSQIKNTPIAIRMKNFETIRNEKDVENQWKILINKIIIKYD